MGDPPHESVAPRGAPGYELLVTDRDSGEPLGLLEEVSLRGALPLTEAAITPGERRQLVLPLPGPESGDALELEALCAWRRPVSAASSAG